MTKNTSASTEVMKQKEELTFKILVIGELATGKTALVKRYVNNHFCTPSRATIGMDFTLKIIKYDENTVIRLEFWDTAGHERFGNLTRVYCRQAVGCFIVFDVTKGSTFEAVTKWKTDLDNKVRLPDGNPVPCVLLANKCDLAKEGLVNNALQMDDFCKEKGFVKWFETSAKENINIEASNLFLISEIMKRVEKLQGVSGRGIDIGSDNEDITSSGGNCCGGGGGPDVERSR